MTTEELLKQGKDRLKELQTGMDMLSAAMSARELLDVVGNPSISVFISAGTGGSSTCLNELWEYDKDSLKDVVERQIDRQITRAKTMLVSTGCFGDSGKAEQEEKEPEIPITEEVKEPEPLQTDATIPERFEKARVKHTVDRKLLADMYFKQGKGCIQIARETGLVESTVFRHIADMKAEKLQAAKECARR